MPFASCRAQLRHDTSLDAPLAWSPDGRWFLAPTNAADGKRFVRIDAATGDVVDIAPMYHLADPGARWSPYSRRFAYARPDDCGGSPPCQSSIVIEDADLTNAVAITDPTKLARGPVWSPDGAWIAFEIRSADPFVASSRAAADCRGADAVDRAARWPRTFVTFVLAGTSFSSFSWSADRGAIDVYEIDRATELRCSAYPKSASAMGRAEQSPRRRTPVAMTGNQSPRSCPSPQFRTVPSSRSTQRVDGHATRRKSDVCQRGGL